MKLFITIYFSLLIISSIAQNNNKVDISQYKKGYVVTKNNEYKQGYLFEQDNSKHKYILFSSTKNDRPIVIGANSIIEYGFLNGLVYELMPYENDSVFMKRVNKKKPYIYYYKINGTKKNYIKSNGTITLLPFEKDRLQDSLLKAFKDCPSMHDQIRYANYSKNRIHNISSLYDNCSNKRIPLFRFGIYGGAILHQLKLDSKDILTYNPEIEMVYSVNYYLRNIDYSIYPMSILGVYLDIPLSQKKMNYSFHPEIEITKNSYSFDNDDGTLKFDVNYINTNLLIRYNTLRKKLSFYIDGGLALSFLNINNLEINGFKKVSYDIAENLIGLGTNIGVEYPILRRNVVNFGIKANYLMPIDYKMPNVWNAGLMVGFGF